MLSTANFSKYLKSCKGAFQPRGRCRATATWAQFLYGLGITPNKNVVSRKFVQVREGDSIALGVDGEVVCHVVNLLGNMSQDGGQVLASTLGGRHWTSIGGIAWNQEDDTKAFSLSYEPCSEDQLAGRHKFFPSWRGGDPDDVMARYSLSLELGTELVWPPPSTPLHERIERLFEYSKLLDDTPAKSKPVFLTGRWVEGSERIYRRACGGEHVDEVVENVRANLDPESPGFDAAVEELRICFQPQRSHTLSYYNARQLVAVASAPEGILWIMSSKFPSALVDTLLAYGNEPEGSWKYALYLSRKQIIDLFRRGKDYHLVYNTDAIIVPLDSTAALWHGKSLRLK